MKKGLLFFAFLFLSMGMLMAQQRTVKGTVTSKADGEPIIGASVVVKSNKTVGGATNVEGRFNFKVPSNAKTLVVSYVGFKTLEVPIQDAEMKITLEADSESLDEVMVVGYSTASKRSFTGSATTVKAAEISKKSVANVIQALSGEVPGVNIVNTNGQPGSSSEVYVRGVGSVNAGTAPLYVVDGVPFLGEISSINPADIESTTLLKDAAATSIYGSRGANGVIVINTKTGSSQKMSVVADIKYGINDQFIPRHDVITSPEEYMEMGFSGLSMLISDLKKKDGSAYTPDEVYQMSLKNIFGNNGIHPKYNMWDVPEGEALFGVNGKINPKATRRYTPELWANEAFQKSNRTEANVQISGGTNKLRAFASVGLLNDVGIINNSDFKRVTGRLNLDMNPFPWLKIRGGLSYSRSHTNAAAQSEYSSTNIFTFIDNMPPIYPVYEREIIERDGKKIYQIKKDIYHEGLNVFDFGEGRAYAGLSNGIAEAFINPNFNTKNSIDYNAKATISFLKHFALENTISGTYTNTFTKSRSNPWYGASAGSHGTIGHLHANIFSYNVLNLLRYNNSFGAHSLEAFAAHEASSWEYERDEIYKKHLVDPFKTELNNAIFSVSPPEGYAVDRRIESYFGQLNYDYADKYFVSLTVRHDGSSRFLNKKWGTFGSAGLAWVATAEDFLKDHAWLKYLKVKASYGSLGQQSGISEYAGVDLYSIGVLNNMPSLLFSTKGSPSLTWERSNMLQFGFESQIGKLLDLSVDYYYKTSSHLIYDRRVAPSNGYAIYKVNDGLLINSGVDVDLTLHALKTKDAYIDFKLNAGFLTNKFDQMPIEPSTGQPKHIDVASVYGRAKGKSLYEFYMRAYEGVDPQTGRSQWTMFYYDTDGNGAFDDKVDTPIINMAQWEVDNPDKVGKVRQDKTFDYNEATLHYVNKSALPTVRGAFTLNTGFKGVELSVQCLYSLGGYGYDGVYEALMQNASVGKNNWHVDMRKRWTPENTNTDVPRLNHGSDPNATGTSTRFLTSNSFLNLANVRLGYDLPKSLIERVHLSKLNVWVAGSNLFLLSARRGYNPSTDLTGASSSYTYSPLSTISAGVSMSF